MGFLSGFLKVGFVENYGLSVQIFWKKSPLAEIAPFFQMIQNFQIDAISSTGLFSPENSHTKNQWHKKTCPYRKDRPILFV